MKPIVYQLPYSEGSFRLNFDVDLNGGMRQENLFIKNESIARYLNLYLEYCLKHLPEEVENIFDNKDQFTKYFNELLNEYNELYQEAFIKLPDDYKNKVKKDQNHF